MRLAFKGFSGGSCGDPTYERHGLDDDAQETQVGKNDAAARPAAFHRSQVELRGP